MIMATRKRHSPEQVVRKLTTADRLLAEGKDVAAVRLVTLGDWVSQDGVNLWVVDSGLKAGDVVIVDGVAKLRPGAPIVLGGAGAPPGAPGASPGAPGAPIFLWIVPLISTAGLGSSGFLATSTFLGAFIIARIA